MSLLQEVANMGGDSTTVLEPRLWAIPKGMDSSKEAREALKKWSEMVRTIQPDLEAMTQSENRGQTSSDP